MIDSTSKKGKELLLVAGFLLIIFSVLYGALNPRAPNNPYKVEARAMLAEDNYSLDDQERICPILAGEIATACSVYRCSPKDITNAARKVCASAREWDSSAKIVDCVNLFSMPNNQSLDKAVVTFSKALRQINESSKGLSPEEKEKRLSVQRRAEIQAALKKQRDKNDLARKRAEEERKTEEMRSASVDSGADIYPKSTR